MSLANSEVTLEYLQTEAPEGVRVGGWHAQGYEAGQQQAAVLQHPGSDHRHMLPHVQLQALQVNMLSAHVSAGILQQAQVAETLCLSFPLLAAKAPMPESRTMADAGAEVHCWSTAWLIPLQQHQLMCRVLALVWHEHHG